MTTITILMSIAEWIGTAAFAISGALTAIDRKLDIFGVVFIGCTTAVGGGILRDIILGIVPPSIFNNLIILLFSAVCSLLIFIISAVKHVEFRKMRTEIEHINYIFDAIGLSAFSVVGAQIAISSGYSGNAVLVVFLGMTTGVGGGVLRDILTDTTPYIFVKHVYALTSIAAACVYFVMCVLLHLPPEYATISAALTCFVLRMLAAKYQWQLPKIKIN